MKDDKMHEIPLSEDDLECHPLSKDFCQRLETGGFLDRLKRIGRAVVTGGASEVARAASSKKGRKVLGTILSGGATLALSKKGRRALGTVLSGGASQLLRNKKARRLLRAVLSGGGSELITNEKLRRAFITGGVSALPKDVRRAIISGGGSLLLDAASSKSKRKALVSAGLKEIQGKKRKKKRRASKKLATVLQRRIKKSKPSRPRRVSRRELSASSTPRKDTYPIEEWMPNFLSLSDEMKRAAHSGLLNIIRNRWNVESGQPYSNSQGYAVLLETLAKQLQGLPVSARNESGDPSWHPSIVDSVGSSIVDGITDIVDGGSSVITDVIDQITPEVPSVITSIIDAIGGTSGGGSDESSSSGGSTTPEIPSVDPIPVTPPPLPSVSTVPNLVGWRRDVYNLLSQVTAEHPNLAFALRDYWVIFGNAMTESYSKANGDASYNAVNKRDGFYKDWGRQVASVGLFQIREPTAYYLRKNKNKLGPVMMNMFPRLPQDPQNNKAAVVATLKKRPDQLYVAMVLHILGCRWIKEYFTLDAEGKIMSSLDPKNSKLTQFANSFHSAAIPAWGVLYRLYWAASSKAGPRTLVANGTAHHKITNRFSGFTRAEYNNYGPR